MENIYLFIKDNYTELLENKDVLRELKPLINNDLYRKIDLLYEKNKSKYF